MELNDTIEIMMSPDYKERFKAEYYQLKIRYNKLCSMLEKWNTGELDFNPSCPKHLLEGQRDHMWDYLVDLESRAKIEGVTL